MGDAVAGSGDPVGWDALVSGLDPAGSGVDDPAGATTGWDWVLTGLAVPAAADPAAGQTFAQWFDQWIYLPTHGSEQDWITSPFGSWVDNNLINPIPHWLFGRDLIGNGADGVGGGSLADAAGKPGGLWFGDRGGGATAATDEGGAGGAAGMIGIGGTGGPGGLDGTPGSPGGLSSALAPAPA